MAKVAPGSIVLSVVAVGKSTEQGACTWLLVIEVEVGWRRLVVDLRPTRKAVKVATRLMGSSGWNSCYIDGPHGSLGHIDCATSVLCGE